MADPCSISTTRGTYLIWKERTKTRQVNSTFDKTFASQSVLDNPTAKGADQHATLPHRWRSLCREPRRRSYSREAQPSSSRARCLRRQQRHRRRRMRVVPTAGSSPTNLTGAAWTSPRASSTGECTRRGRAATARCTGAAAEP